MRVHLCILTWNRLELTQKCLASLLEKTPPGYALTVVDNGSADGTQEYLHQLATCNPHMNVHFLRRNMGLAVASNLAWDDAAEADFCVKMDNDLEFRDPQWLERLVDITRGDPRVGVAGYRLCPWHTGTPITLADGSLAYETTSCNGGCVCIPRSVHERLGFWNEGFGRYGYEDLDYSWRARRAGYLVVYAPQEDAIIHLGAEPECLDPEQEIGKLTNRTASLSGTKAYLMYLLLYDKGILPLKMERKYLPTPGPDGLTFPLNPSHKALQRLLVNMIKTVDVSQKGNLSQLDLRAWQKTGNLS